MSTFTTFTIYTTGIADTYQDKFVLLLLWEQICNNITSCIPSNFTNIIIHHHDIMVDIPDKEHFTYIINQFIQETDLDSRIRTHDFSCKPLDLLNLNHHHLIIDMAHIFCYGLNKTVLYENKAYPINSIYIGWNNPEFAKRQLFKMVDGQVITFIHCLENAGFFERYDPVELINKIIKSIKKDLMDVWRQTKGKVLPPEDGGTFDDMFIHFNITDQILDKLFSYKTREEILDFSTYTCEDFNRKLCDPKFK